MAWTRATRRNNDRNQRRPGLESLEVRTLLSVSHHPKPARAHADRVAHRLTLHASHPAGSPVTNADGSTNFDAIIGASAARAAYGVDGTGMTVAVIDGGVNYAHEALGGGFGAGHKVVAGWDFADNNADPSAKTMEHGTAVAGLIASGDPSHPGVAPGADLASLRIFNDSNVGDFNLVADALQWVITNHTTYNITAVNLSMSDGGNYAQNWFANDGAVGQQITSLVTQLDALNIPVVTAAGNSFANNQQGMGFPSIIPETISVTSTDASGNLASDAQRLGSALGGASATKIAAPGVNVVSTSSGNTFGAVTGTSFAAPMVTGAVVLMQQVYEERFHTLPTVDQIDTWLEDGADPINDPATGITIGELDIPKSIALIPNPAPQTLTPPPPSSGPGSTTTTPPVTTPVAPPVTTPVAPPVTTPVAPPTPVVTPPVDTLTPPASTTPTTTVSQTPTGTGDGSSSGNLQLWVNGQSINNASASNPGGALAGLPTWFVQALSSLKNWWAGSGDTSSAQVWTANPPSTVSPAGTTLKTGVAHPAGTLLGRPHAAKSAAAHAAKPAHTFVDGRRSR